MSKGATTQGNCIYYTSYTERDYEKVAQGDGSKLRKKKSNQLKFGQ
jgi:hypothetical protein